MVTGSGFVTAVQATGSYLYNNKSLPGRDAQIESPDPVPYYNIGWQVTSYTPEGICIEVFARTSTTDTNVNYTAIVAAKETYPQ